MKVHDLLVALSQQSRKAEVTVKDDKILVGGSELEVLTQKEIKVRAQQEEQREKKEKEKQKDAPAPASEQEEE